MVLKCCPHSCSVFHGGFRSFSEVYTETRQYVVSCLDIILQVYEGLAPDSPNLTLSKLDNVTSSQNSYFESSIAGEISCFVFPDFSYYKQQGPVPQNLD